MSIKEIAKNLNKCPTTIYKAVKKLDLDSVKREGKPWNENEVAYLKNNYLSMTYKEIAKELNRSYKSVMGKAHLLGLEKATNAKNWTDEEIEILRNSINTESYEEISKKINRSLGAIYTKVWELQLIPDEYKGYKKLKKEQILFIIENSDKFTDSEFAAKFKISISAVEDIRKKHGIIKTGNEVTGPTYIEVFVKNFLDEITLPYLFQEKIDNLYVPDFQIYANNKKIIIEVNGDYYHCNPYIYKDGPKDEIQVKHVIRDYYKKCYYLSRGYILLEIWESEINNCPEDVKNKIKSAVYG